MKSCAMTLVYNTPELVDAMRRQLPDILVIDNGSTEPDAAAWLRSNHNRYFAGGWNFAMRHAESRWAWMLNSDVEGVSPELLDELVEIGERHNAVVVSPAIAAGCGHRFMRPGVGVRTCVWVDWVAPVVRVDWFKAAGGFDEELPGWGTDIDLCYRAPGVKVVASEKPIEHLWGATAKKHSDRTMYQIQEARKYLIKKHGREVKFFAPSFFRKCK